MTEQTINAIFDRFGATAETLVPKVIAYQTHMNKLGLIVSLCFLALAVTLIALSIWKDGEWGYDAVMWCGIIGGIIFLASAVAIICFAVSLHAWKIAPEVCAYEAILDWVKY